jgi:hypothetical protein
MSDYFQSYITRLQQLPPRSAKSLVDTLLTLGLFPAVHALKTYGSYTSYQHSIASFAGFYQDPAEFATMLWALKRDCHAINTKSFLYIGAHTGYAYFAMREFLKHIINPNLQSKVIDTSITPQSLNPTIRPYIEADLHSPLSSAHIRDTNEYYDIVMIDNHNDRSFDAIKCDYNNIKRKARIIIITHTHSQEFPGPGQFVKHVLYKTVKMFPITSAKDKFGYTIVYPNVIA